MDRLTNRALILVAFSLSTFLAAFSQDVVLGVLEDNEGHYAGEPNFRTVRTVFRKEGRRWQPFRSNCPDQECLKKATSDYPSEATWTIAFDGKNLGQVASRIPKDFAWYSSVGQGDIVSKGPVPTIGKREASGFADAVTFRPLVANSRPYFKDPASWKIFAPGPDVTVKLRGKFRGKFPKLCRLSKSDDSKLEPFHYRDADIRVTKAYTSKTGWALARLHVEAVDCDDTEAGFDIDDPWFVVSPDGSATYLDSGIQLVDAGDYDNDGKSELLFSINQDNHGGYELFYDDFRQRAIFDFNYH